MTTRTETAVDAESPTAEQWHLLSAIPERRTAFSYDLYVRECWAEATAIWGERTMDILRSVAVLMLKPDAVVGRRAGRIIDFVTAAGFVPIDTVVHRLTRHSMRELYRYDWHTYTIDRLAFCTYWYTSEDVIAFVLRDALPDPHLPSSVRLADLKGSTPEERSPHHLRSVLDPPNRILNFVHVTDEPADVLREIGIFLDRDARRPLLERIGERMGYDGTAAALDAVAELESRTPHHDLDFANSLRRLARAPSVSQAAVNTIAAAFEHGPPLLWDQLRALVDPAAEGVDRWDFICVASHVIASERDVDPVILPVGNRAAWASAR